MRTAAILTSLVMILAACGESGSSGDGLPDALAFEFTRTDAGDPLGAAEVDAFTRKLTGFWKQVGFFPWVLRISHGVHESTGKRDYMVWWSGVNAYREGDQVRFFHHDPDGGGHNIMIPTPRLLAATLGGYMLTGDPQMAEVAEQYCKGITATMLGMVYDENDAIDWLAARNIATISHTYQTQEGYTKEVDYTGWHTEYEHWNTCRFEYQNNPHWGSVWVTNMRSKDDVPHLFMAVPFLTYAASRAESPDVKEACAETLEHMTAFAKDIVDQGYRIRSKDKDGVPFIPGYTGDEEKDQAAGDLASFVMWEELIENGECNAKRTSALIGYGDGRELDCGRAAGNLYEDMAVQAHYYNHDIIRFFHSAHVANALINHDDTAARELLEGMAERIDGYMQTTDAELPEDRSRSEWERDIVQLAVRAAAYGYPLTSEEARLIQTYWNTGVDEYSTFEYWNLWAPEHEDGQLPYRPADWRDEERWPGIEDMVLPLEYCWSPLKNPAGAQFINCDIVADPSQW